MSRKPSEKDIWKVKMIMKHTGVEPEKEVFENAETCKAFIKNHRKTYPPTDEEISNVQELQKETGLAVPDGFLRSGYLTFRLTCLLESIAYTINNPVFEYDGEFRLEYCMKKPLATNSSSTVRGIARRQKS